MLGEPGHGRSWTEMLVGWLITLVVVVFVAQAMVELVRPLLPWVGAAIVVAAGGYVWSLRRDRW